MNSEITIDFGAGSPPSDQKTLFDMLKRALGSSKMEKSEMQAALQKAIVGEGLSFRSDDVPDDADHVHSSTLSKMEVENPEEGLQNEVEIDYTSSLLDSVGSLKSSLSSAANSAFSVFSALNTDQPKIDIPAVMVSQRYGRELLTSYKDLVLKGEKPQLIICADSIPDPIDGVMHEGLFDDEEEDAGRYPKMKIDSDAQNKAQMAAVRLWTSKPWGALIQKNKQGTWELRIMNKHDRNGAMLSVHDGLLMESKSPVSVLSPGAISINPVYAYSSLIDMVCLDSILPHGQDLYIRSAA